jgi:hypothetical protein
MKWLPGSLGTWGFVISIVTLVLAYPVGVIVNATTPLVIDWISRWSKSSLEKRIGKLEAKLADWEQHPALDDVHDELLWGIKSIKINILSALNSIGLLAFFEVRAVANTESPRFIEFEAFIFFYTSVNLAGAILLRRGRDLRFKRSRKVRENLRKDINELKTLRDNWDR